MNQTPLPIRTGIWLWLIAALLVGKFQLLIGLPSFAVPGILFGLTVLLLLGYAKLPALRSWIDGLDLRALVLLHVTRFVGIYFLVLYSRGILPGDFAVPAGWGDIIVAVLAVIVCVVPLAQPTRTRAIRFWNILGLVDLLLVIVTAARLNQANDGQMRALTVLPLSLLPTFLVPLLLFVHVIIFLRLYREEQAAT
jgi:hypothetical protein